MLRIYTGFLISIALASPIQAANVITFGKDSPVVFLHKEHQKKLGGCTKCHGTTVPGSIDKLSKDWAHTTCIGCHSEGMRGPLDCSGCHTMY